jgi:hypothetical protein
MGTQSDAFSIDASTLEPVKREVTGAGTITLAYSPTTITGEMGGMGQKMSVNQSLEVPVLGDGSALELAVAVMPLAEGFSTPIRYFDPMTQKVRFMKLAVTGKTTSQVPAGSFPTFTVEMTALDGDESGQATLQVMEKIPHHVVKSVYKLPAAMGGGTMSMELSEGGASE